MSKNEPEMDDSNQKSHHRLLLSKQKQEQFKGQLSQKRAYGRCKTFWMTHSLLMRPAVIVVV